MVDEEDIFSENFEKPEKKTEIKKPIIEIQKVESRFSKKTLGIMGIIIIGAVAVSGLYLSGAISLIQNILNPIELGKSIDEPNNEEVKNNPTEQEDDDPFKEVSRTTDMVEVEKTKDILGYYLVTSNGEWDGQYVDFRKLPSYVHLNGTQKINFRCYNDEFLKTSTYFATFRNSVENNLNIQLFINDKFVEEKSTDTNTAIILEGSCLGN